MDHEDQNNFERVAEGLAGHGYAIVDDFLSHSEVKEILSLDEFSEGMLHFRRAAVGKNLEKQVNSSIRGDYIQWIDRDKAAQPLQVYLKKLDRLTRYINESLFLSLKEFEVHLTIYPAGAGYKRHLDQFKADDHRKLSVVCYLNEGWTDPDGGHLRLYLPGSTRDVLPTAGRLVCFRSDQVEHEVLPSVRARMSITGWLLVR